MSDFDTEKLVFDYIGQIGLGPVQIERTDVYRVEEYIQGRALTMTELRNPLLIKKCVEGICDLNYNKDLNRLVKE